MSQRFRDAFRAAFLCGGTRNHNSRLYTATLASGNGGNMSGRNGSVAVGAARAMSPFTRTSYASGRSMSNAGTPNGTAALAAITTSHSMSSSSSSKEKEGQQQRVSGGGRGVRTCTFSSGCNPREGKGGSRCNSFISDTESLLLKEQQRRLTMNSGTSGSAEHNGSIQPLRAGDSLETASDHRMEHANHMSVTFY